MESAWYYLEKKINNIMSKSIPKSAKAIVIGGGVGGCSTAYHLAKFGW